MIRSAMNEKTFFLKPGEKIEIIVQYDPLTDKEYLLVTDGFYSFIVNEIIFPEFKLKA